MKRALVFLLIVVLAGFSFVERMCAGEKTGNGRFVNWNVGSTSGMSTGTTSQTPKEPERRVQGKPGSAIKIVPSSYLQEPLQPVERKVCKPRKQLEVIPQQRQQVYVSSYYLFRDEYASAIDVLEEAGYIVTTNRRAPLRLSISINRVYRGDSILLRLKKRYGFGGRGYIYKACVYLRDYTGRVVARAWAESSPFVFDLGAIWGSKSRGLDFRGSYDSARASAVTKAVKRLVLAHRQQQAQGQP